MKHEDVVVERVDDPRIMSLIQDIYSKSTNHPWGEGSTLKLFRYNPATKGYAAKIYVNRNGALARYNSANHYSLSENEFRGGYAAATVNDDGTIKYNYVPGTMTLPKVVVQVPPDPFPLILVNLVKACIRKHTGQMYLIKVVSLSLVIVTTLKVWQAWSLLY